MEKDGSEKVLDFLEEIEKYAGQKILEFHSGGTSYSTAIQSPPVRFEKYIILGKLKTPAYLIKEEQIIANIIKKRHKFTPSKGWKITKDQIILNGFLEDYWPENSKEILQLKKLIDKSKATKLKSLEGLIINIFPKRELKIGGSTEYDSLIKTSLIIGDKRVKNYLKEADLTVIEKKIYEGEIPKF